MSGRNHDITVNDSVVGGDIISGVKKQKEINNLSLNLNDSVVMGDVTQILNDDEQIIHLIDEKLIPNLHDKTVNSINRKDWDEADFCIAEIHKIDNKIITWWNDNHPNKSLINEWTSLIKGQLELLLIEDEGIDTFYNGLELLKKILSNYSNADFVAARLVIDLYKAKIDYHLNKSMPNNNLSFHTIEKEFNNTHLCLRKFLTDNIINLGNIDIKKIRNSAIDEKCNRFKECVNASVKKQRSFMAFSYIVVISLLLSSIFVVTTESGVLACYGILIVFFLLPMFGKNKNAKNDTRVANKLIDKINTIQSKLEF